GTAVRGQAADPPRFEKDVLPVLTTRCLKCHGGGKPKAGLDLRTRAGLLKGGESGPAPVPGASARRLGFEMVRKGERPPAENGKLPAEEVALIQAWIDGGAPADSAAEAPGRNVPEAGREFWAFQKPVRPPVPSVRDAGRVRTAIDA